MSDLRFLVYGGKGWIGGHMQEFIKARGHTAILAQARADDEVAVEKELKDVKPDRVISLIGRTRGGEFLTIDYLEQKGKLVENMRDNLWGPLCLAHLCTRQGIHLTYMGTGCIFEYNESQGFPIDSGVGFTEESKPNFFGSSYSTCKGFTDRLMHFFEDSVLNVRIRMPITGDHSPYNFITKIVKYRKVVNIPNSMTVMPELLPIMVDCAIEKRTGTINLTNPGVISHVEVLQLYQKHVDPEFWYETFTQEEQDKILLSGRSNNLLDTTKLKGWYPQVDDIKTAVEKVCIEMGKKHGKVDHGKGPKP
eukprot:TRINITY_DN3235_c0_g1_i2.p1 TRINITY_DN3235_c0_g1~~TRINITY_DN3235_c0_g1_i2.p1  ORF type:complete len:327 (+),score=129.03 TRINITY_DN3235_c0_g1_i2:63-983(+)